MQILTLTELTHLSAESAVQRFWDGLNYRALRWVLALAGPVALVGILLSAGTDWWRTGAAVMVAACVLAVLAIRRGAFFAENTRSVLIVFLAATGVATALSLPIGIPSVLVAGVGLPLALLFFRLKVVERFGLLALFAAAAVWLLLRIDSQEGSLMVTGLAALVAGVGLASLVLGTQLTRRQENEFLDSWHLEVTRNREQRRMSSELSDAREIQLSMLPDATLALPWLDFSAVSIPASEVGGDYYDYFVLGENRLAVVIGDVAGHGVASGLVLSGIRSGLFLLRDELDRPARVLDRLNEMVRSRFGARQLVTLQIAVLDWRHRRLVVANAGHPPLLLLNRGSVRNVGAGSLPLGTGLKADYREQEEPLQSGSSLVLYTDGAQEMRNFRGIPLGDAQLRSEVVRAAAAGSARNIRDSLLNGLSRYKGDVEQHDDLTLVVLKTDRGLGF